MARFLCCQWELSFECARCNSELATYLLLLRQHAKFDPMTVGVGNEGLQCSIWSGFTLRSGRTAAVETIFVSVQIVNQQSQVSASMVRMHGLVTITNQMQFLINAKPKPSPGKIKGRPVDLGQLQHVTVERHASANIRDVQGNVI